MFADIFYPTFTHPNNHHFSVFYTEKKPKIIWGFVPTPSPGYQPRPREGGAGYSPSPDPQLRLFLFFAKTNVPTFFLYYCIIPWHIQ